MNARTKPKAIEFFEFATGRKIRIAQIQKELEEGSSGPCLAVSPDERWILYTQVDRWASDIMLLENFR